MSRDRAMLTSMIAALFLAAPAMAGERIGLGRPATPSEIAAWDIDIRPDGWGLPPGRGSVDEGDALWAEKCASCHGDFGEGVGRMPAMIGGAGTLASERPTRTIGSYWPYLSTVFDYVRRAMPYGDAQSLTADETYALTAYILHLNDLVDEEFGLSADNFNRQALPNADGFIVDDRLAETLYRDRAPPCITGCKAKVDVVSRASDLDLTPLPPAME